MSTASRRTATNSRRVLVVSTCIAMLGLVFAPAARAHGSEDSDKAKLLVQQAIAYLVNKPGDTMDVKDKINDALEAPDQSGTDLEDVKMAMDDLDAGNMMQVRHDLMAAIGARPMMAGEEPVPIDHAPPALTGADTGNLVALDKLPGRHGLRTRDWVALGFSIAAILIGGAVSFRLRPRIPVIPTGK